MLHVASFNIQQGVAIARALDVFNENAELRRADVVLLQEMDAVGTELMADRTRHAVGVLSGSGGQRPRARKRRSLALAHCG